MKPRILFLLHLPPPVHGAAMAGSYIQQSETINCEFESTYINLATASSLADIGKAGLKKYITTFRLWYKVFSVLSSKGYQLCYLTINAKGAAWYKELAIVLLVKLFKVPLIYHYHNKGVASNSNNFFKRLLYRFQFNNTKTILLSALLYNDIAEFVKTENVFYCGNGIPEASLLSFNDIDNINYLKKEVVQILFLSNLIKTKGVFILLDACVILKSKGIAFECIFIGGETDITAIQFITIVEKLELSQHVFYKGKKYGKEKEAAFLSADIFAFPTYYDNETFGLVNLEAMQFSLPIISTFEGGIPDVVENNITGFLVPQQDATALAEKLELLIKDPILRKKMGAAGRKKYEQNFKLEIFEKKIVNILLDAIKDSYQVKCQFNSFKIDSK